MFPWCGAVAVARGSAQRGGVCRGRQGSGNVKGGAASPVSVAKVCCDAPQVCQAVSAPWLVMPCAVCCQEIMEIGQDFDGAGELACRLSLPHHVSPWYDQ